MNYKIVGKPLTHSEMIEIAKGNSTLYAINTDDNTVAPLAVKNIVVNLDNGQWEFDFLQKDRFEENEQIFKTKRTAELYLKRRTK